MMASRLHPILRLRLFLFLLLCVSVLPAPPAAFALSPQETVRRLQEAYRGVDSFSTNFSQSTSLPGRKMKTARGTAQFLRPSYMRWDYAEPERQIFINDGSYLTVYQEKNRQMLVSPITGMDEDLSLLLFNGSVDVSQRFELHPVAAKDLPRSETAAHAVELIPKTVHNQVSKIVVVCDKNFRITRLRMVDHFETVTDILFSATKVNVLTSGGPEERRRLITSRFSFTPPPGTEIIQQGQ